MLDADITVEEVVAAIKSLKVDKRQGLDGFSAKFYKLHPIVASRLVALFNEVKQSKSFALMLLWYLSLTRICSNGQTSAQFGY